MPSGAAALMRGQQLARRVDDRERRGVGLLQDREVGGALAVDAHDVVLHREAVVDVRDVAEQHGGAVDDLDRDGVELGDRARAALRSTSYSVPPMRARARGQDDVRREQRVDDVLRREPLARRAAGSTSTMIWRCLPP